jgi:putative transposase
VGGELRKAGASPWLLGECGKPKVIVSDNGTELTSNAILRWAYDHKIASLALHRPG